jgi:hypothetical protein
MVLCGISNLELIVVIQKVTDGTSDNFPETISIVTARNKGIAGKYIITNRLSVLTVATEEHKNTSQLSIKFIFVQIINFN